MKFTKKPVTIDAVQWSKDGDHPNVVELPKKVRDTIDERTTALGVDGLRWIGTLEGGHIVSAGDWIITGVQGEQYPCKPDIFEMTYSPADTTQDPRDEELARLREQVVAQQARIAQMRDGLLHYSDIRPDTLGRTVVLSDEGAIARNALATTDDLSALAEHDKQVWNEALNTVKHRTSDLRLSERQLEIVKGLKR